MIPSMKRGVWLLLFLAGCPSRSDPPKGTSMSQDQDELRKDLLKQAMTAPTDRERSEVLRRHGPIREDEIPYLVSKAQSSFGTLRKGAVRLLCLSPAKSAKAALQDLIKGTDDVEVWALALSEFLDAGDAKSLAELSAKRIPEALAHKDPTVAGIGMRAGLLIGMPGLREQLEIRLAQGSREEKESVLKALADVGAGPLEPRLRDLLASPPDWLRDFVPLYAALSHGEDASLADLFRSSLTTPKEHQEIDFHNALRFTRSRRPWLKNLLLGMLQSDVAKERERGFGILEGWGAEYSTQLLLVCERWLKEMPDDEAARRKYLASEPAYFRYLGTLAGKDFSPMDKDAMLAFLKTR